MAHLLCRSGQRRELKFRIKNSDSLFVTGLNGRDRQSRRTLVTKIWRAMGPHPVSGVELFLSWASRPELKSFKLSSLDFFSFFSIIASCCQASPLSLATPAPSLSTPLPHRLSKKRKGEKKKQTVEWMIWEPKTSKWGGYILKTAASITTFSLLSNIAVCWADSAPYLNLAAVP